MTLDRYYTLGRSGLKVSRLALGTMTFGTEWGWGADQEDARAMFDAYLDCGGNFFDTADLYTNGTSEAWLGEFIAARKARDRAVIATKYSYNAEPRNPNAGGNSRKNMIRAVEGSLRRLRTDYIDLYFLHTWDRLTAPDEVMRAFDDLVRSGKVRYVGLSDVPAWFASRAQTLAEWRGYEPLAALQLEYSLVERAIEHEFVALGTGYGMGIVVWSPLASGLLSGKYRPTDDDFAGDGRFATMKDSPNPVFSKLKAPRNREIVSTLAAVADEIGRSMAQVAINWAANRPGVASVLVGATRPAQLTENLAALDFTLPDELAQRLEAASAPPTSFPYVFFGDEVQSIIAGGTRVSDKPAGYWPEVETSGAGGSLIE
ncbi:MAG TPA: aldo/keto reductase [Steroidobacteraceae bacterium]|nr:aldo/keto reductase [Steroidobacteraceae bacterium]